MATVKVEQQPYQFTWEGVGEHVMPPIEDITDIIYMGRGSPPNFEYGSEEMVKSFVRYFFAGEHHMHLAWKAHEFAKNTYKEIGNVRDTGELYLMHALRLMIRFFGFYSAFQAYCDETNSGFNIWEDYSATKMLSAATVVGYLHDLPEDAHKFQYTYKAYFDEIDGIRKISVKSQTLYGSSPMMQLIGLGLEALKKPEGYKDLDPISVAQYQVQQILDLPKKLRLVQDELGLTEEQIEFFSFLIASLKLCDRLDNEMTLFRRDTKTGDYIPMTDKKVAKIIDSTLQAFYPLQEAVTRYILADRSDMSNFSHFLEHGNQQKWPVNIK